MNVELEMIGVIKQIYYPKKFQDYQAQKTAFAIETEKHKFFICEGYHNFALLKNHKVKLYYLDNQCSDNKIRFNMCQRLLTGVAEKENFILELFSAKAGKTLLNNFGVEKTFEILSDKNSDGQLNSVGISTRKISKALKSYENFIRFNKTVDELKKLNLSCFEISKIIKNNIDTEKVLKNPYILSLLDVCSFERIDAIANVNAKVKVSGNRIATSFVDQMKKINNDIYIKKSVLLKRVKTQTDVDEENVMKVFDVIKKNDIFIEEEEKIFKKDLYEAKTTIENFLREGRNENSLTTFTSEEIDNLLVREKISLGDEQRQAVETSLNKRISIITGGPGTGKTTVLGCILKLLMTKMSANDICLCSPTGKAAVRMAESTGHSASTIHHTLLVDQAKSTPDELSFVYNEYNKLPCKVVVVDEASMIDYFIASSLLKAIKPIAQIIFVGDKNQLPPVKAGFFFRDILNNGVFTTTLLKTYRQSEESSVVFFAKKIQKDSLEPCNIVERRKYFENEGAKKDFAFISLPDDPERINDFIADVYLKAIKTSSICDSVVLTSQRENEGGVKQINNAIQKRLLGESDENSFTRNKYRFKVGSRIISIRNNINYDIVNGQMGFIKEIDLDNDKVSIEFDNGREVVYDSEHLEELALGYCITVHKSQGSEWKNVIQVLYEKHHNNSKPLLYTGMTRAKKTITFLGKVKDFVEISRRSCGDVKSYLNQ